MVTTAGGSIVLTQHRSFLIPFIRHSLFSIPGLAIVLRWSYDHSTLLSFMRRSLQSRCSSTSTSPLCLVLEPLRAQPPACPSIIRCRHTPSVTSFLITRDIIIIASRQFAYERSHLRTRREIEGRDRRKRERERKRERVREAKEYEY